MSRWVTRESADKRAQERDAPLTGEPMRKHQPMTPAVKEESKERQRKEEKISQSPHRVPQSPQTQSVEAPPLLMTLCETPQETPVFRCVVVALGGCAQHLAGGGPSEWVQILSVTNCLLLFPVTVIKRTQSAYVTTAVAQYLSFCYVMIVYFIHWP